MSLPNNREGLFPSRTVDGILYRLIEPSDAAALEELVLDAFFARMPLYREVGATSRSDVEISLNYLPQLTVQPHSIVAEEPAPDGGRRLIGARLSELERRNEPPAKHPLMVDAQLQAKYPREAIVMRSVGALLTAVDYFAALHPTAADTALFSLMLTVRESHSRRGVGRRLMQCAMELAPRLGAQLVVGITQSGYSQRIYEALDFKRLYAIDLPAYVDPAVGGRPFAGLAGTAHSEAVLFAKPV